MSAERRPPLAPAPELVGPDEAREDVAELDQRRLVMRALDEVLRLRHDTTQRDALLMRELGGVGQRLAALERRVAAGGPASFRDPESSWHDFDAELAQTRKILAQRAKDPNDPTTEADARAFVLETLQHVSDARELKAWRAWKGHGWKLTWLIVGALVAAAITGVVGHFEGRATAPAAQTTGH